MTKRTSKLLVASGVLTFLALVPPAAAEPLPTVYVQRELTAPPAVRTQLSNLRQQIRAQGLSYTVGYTSVLDRPLANITGLVVPPNAAQLAAAHAPIQKQLLEADDAMRIAYLKAHPEAKPMEKLPTFTATSPRADWRTLGVVPPIRDQGDCGSCWAFAATGAFESSYMIRNPTPPDSSEQAMLVCAAAGTCKGGWTAPALDWLTTNGSDKESDYPYVASSSPACKPFTAEYKSAAWGYIRPDGTIATDAEMKDAIVKYGPIVVALYATNAFKAYAGGVYYESIPWPTALNHAVVLVGWDDNQVVNATKKGAWILRNSWGTDWGTTADQGTERGYMYLAYGSSNVGIWSQWVKAPSTYYRASTRIETIMRSRALVPIAPVLPPAPIEQKPIAPITPVLR